MRPFKCGKSQRKSTPHVREGSQAPACKKTNRHSSLLDSANDWQLLVDGVPNRTTFPPCTGVITLERPDVIIYSESTKTIIWGELTVPLEENVKAAVIRKTDRYCKSDSKRNKLSLADECRRNGWKVHPYTFEVGSLGWVAHSTTTFLRAIGFPKTQLNCMIKQVSDTTSRSSYFIWACRNEPVWNPPDLLRRKLVTNQPTSKAPDRRQSEFPPREVENDFDALVADAEDFVDQRPPSPDEPAAPRTEHPVAFTGKSHPKAFAFLSAPSFGPAPSQN